MTIADDFYWCFTRYKMCLLTPRLPEQAEYVATKISRTIKILFLLFQLGSRDQVPQKKFKSFCSSHRKSSRQRSAALWMQNSLIGLCVSEHHGKETARKPLFQISHVLLLWERMRKVAVMMLLCTLEKTSDSHCYSLKKQKPTSEKLKVMFAFSLVTARLL